MNKSNEMWWAVQRYLLKIFKACFSQKKSAKSDDIWQRYHKKVTFFTEPSIVHRTAKLICVTCWQTGKKIRCFTQWL